MATTLKRFTFDEGSSGSIAFTILDRLSDPVPVAGITEAELTLFDWDTGAAGAGDSPRPGIINGRDRQNVLNTNDVTLSDAVTAGRVTWLVQPEDNVIVTNVRQVERHRAMFYVAWSGGAFRFECELVVKNLRLTA